MHWLIPSRYTALARIIGKRRAVGADHRRIVGLAENHVSFYEDILQMKAALRDEIVPHMIWDPDLYVVMILPGGLSEHCNEMYSLTTYLNQLAGDPAIQRSKILGITPEHGMYTQTGDLSANMKTSLDIWCTRALNHVGRMKFVRARQACANLGKKNIPTPSPEAIAKSIHQYVIKFWEHEKRQSSRVSHETCQYCNVKYGKHYVGCIGIPADMILKTDNINQRKEEAKAIEEESSSDEEDYSEGLTEASLSELEHDDEAKGTKPEAIREPRKRHKTALVSVEIDESLTNPVNRGTTESDRREAPASLGDGEIQIVESENMDSGVKQVPTCTKRSVPKESPCSLMYT